MAEKQVICDTDVLIDYWNTTSIRHLVSKRILEDEIGLNNIVVSAISLMELLVGASNKSEEKIIKRNLNRFNIALINNDITNEAIDLLGYYRLSHGLAIPDCFIAATAKIMQIPLFTYNVKDFRFIENLIIYKF
jgi:predicted nucleic acid-binding protein